MNKDYAFAVERVAFEAHGDSPSIAGLSKQLVSYADAL